MSSSPRYTHEHSVGLHAVHTASLLTKLHLLTYQSTKSHVDQGTKADASEVTTADFAAQAVLISILHHDFPDDSFIAEESAEMLKSDGKLLGKVWELVQSAQSTVSDSAVDLHLPQSKEEMIDVIDLGQQGGKDATRIGRTWIMDPIDGTKTYIRGQQYAVCLCLIDKGEQKVGILGCPNLDLETVAADGRVVIEESRVDLEPDGGWILSAIRGEATHISRMKQPAALVPIGEFIGKKGDALEAITTVNTNTIITPQQPDITLHFTDSSASPHLSKPLHNRIFEYFADPVLTSRKLSVPAVPEGSPSLALDCWSMQLKYVLLALRAEGADAMIRVPPTSTYHAAVWDHAGGQLLLTESGGMLADANGQAFLINGTMRKLEENWGVCGVRGGTYYKRDGTMANTREVYETVQRKVKEEVHLRKNLRQGQRKQD